MTKIINLNRPSIDNIRKMVVDSQSQKVEIAQALTTDKAHKSIDAKTITPQQSSPNIQKDRIPSHSQLSWHHRCCRAAR